MHWKTAVVRGAIASTILCGTSESAAAQATSWYQNAGLTYPGSNTQSVWASSATDVWLAGGVFNLQHWNGSAWSMPTQPGTLNRYNVFGLQSGQIYTSGQNGFGSGAIHSCSTTTCSVVYTAETELFGIWGRSPGDLFTSGDGIIRHFNGSSWVDLPTGLSSAFNTHRLGSISGGETRTFVVGSFGNIFGFDGGTLSQMTSGTTSHLNSVSAVNDNFAFAVGQGGTILNWNGALWSSMLSPTTQDLNGVFALSPTSAYAAGANGTVLYWNGASWTPVDVGIDGFLGTPYALSESQVYIPRANGQFAEVINSDASLGGTLLIETTVPEPSTTVLMLAGLAAVACATRARIRRQG